MKYYFGRKDYRILQETIAGIQKRVREIGQDMGESCQEGAETFHDNFTFEDGERQQAMLTKRYAELRKVLDNAIPIENTDQTSQVAFGNIVIFKDVDTDETKTVKIGSFMIFQKNDGGIVSYNSPLGKLLLEAKEGEIRKGKIVGKEKKIEITKISLP